MGIGLLFSLWRPGFGSDITPAGDKAVGPLTILDERNTAECPCCGTGNSHVSSARKAGE